MSYKKKNAGNWSNCKGLIMLNLMNLVIILLCGSKKVFCNVSFIPRVPQQKPAPHPSLPVQRN